MTEERNTQEEGQELEFISEPVDIEDEDLEEVSGGGCSNGSGCSSGSSSFEP